MKELSSPLDKKAHEMGVLLIRISVYIRRRDLRERIERLSFSLVESSASRNPDVLWHVIPSLISLMHLGRTLYEIEPINAGFALDGLADLYESFQKSVGVFSSDKDMASGALKVSRESGKVLAHSSAKSLTSIASSFPEKSSENPAKENNPAITLKEFHMSNSFPNNSASESGYKTEELIVSKGNSADNPAIRQSAIFERMNNLSGKAVQLKDIIPLFPGVSERTLRYDLQRLSAEGKVERIGAGGPATYYKVRTL